MRYFILFLLATLFWSPPADAQKLLFQKNKHRYALYEVGDVITFRLRQDRSKHTEQIRGFADTLIVFEEFGVNPKEISGMWIDRRTKNWYFFRNKYKKILPLAGGMYLFADIVNTGEVDKQAAIVCGTLIGMGLLAKWLISEELKIKRKKKLAVLMPLKV